MRSCDASFSIILPQPQNAALPKQEELDGSDFDPETIKGSKQNGGADPEILAPDLLAACKANDEGWAQDLLADGVSPAYSDPESGMFHVFCYGHKLRRFVFRRLFSNYNVLVVTMYGKQGIGHRGEDGYLHSLEKILSSNTLGWTAHCLCQVRVSISATIAHT